jgi:hypothetical protein
VKEILAVTSLDVSLMMAGLAASPAEARADNKRGAIDFMADGKEKWRTRSALLLIICAASGIYRGYKRAC